MVSRTLSSAFVIFALSCMLSVSASGTANNHVHVARNRRHQQLTNRLVQAEGDVETGALVNSVVEKPLRKRRACRPPQTTTSTQATHTTHLAIHNTTHTTSSRSTASPSPTKTSPGKGGNGVGKPPNWPTQTQAGAAPTATRAHPGDPFLMELSKAYDNSNNKLFNTVWKGQMTYYGQGLGACGDTYDDSSFTAAVSKLMYDSWPGAMAGEMNRNPICGPFVPGRKTINSAGSFITAVKGQSFVNLGGDGLLNCDTKSQCHVPLTATVKHGGKSIQVRIVDRCEGCAIGDIDLTPTAFAALEDPGVGRTDVEWFFNNY